MNRFSKDISSIDQEAAPILLYLLQSILSCLASLLSVLPVPDLLLTKYLPLALTGGSDGHLVCNPSLHHWSSLDRRVSALAPSRARPKLTTLHSTLPSLYYIIGALYLSLSRELKRLDSVTRSPIFVAFGECLQGMYVPITLRPSHQIFPDIPFSLIQGLDPILRRQRSIHALDLGAG